MVMMEILLGTNKPFQSLALSDRERAIIDLHLMKAQNNLRRQRRRRSGGDAGGDAAHQTRGDGSAESDLSGTALAAYLNVAAFAGGLDFTNSATGALSSIAVGAAFSNLDGLSRDDRLRYDTPDLGGLVLSSSLVDGGEWDAALAYGGAFPALKVAAKVAYANQSATRNFPEEIVSGSLSGLHWSGLNLTLGGGLADDDDSTRDAIDFWYAKLGHISSIFTVGASHFSLDLGEYNDAAASGDEARTYGV